MTNLERILKGLKEMGIETRTMEDIMQTVNFLGSIDIVNSRDKNFKIEYFKDGHFKMETSWSNQKITTKWLERATKIYNLINES